MALNAPALEESIGMDYYEPFILQVGPSVLQVRVAHFFEALHFGRRGS
jgi:hypothetical protein